MGHMGHTSLGQRLGLDNISGLIESAFTGPDPIPNANFPAPLLVPIPVAAELVCPVGTPVMLRRLERLNERVSTSF